MVQTACGWNVPTLSCQHYIEPPLAVFPCWARPPHIVPCRVCVVPAGGVSDRLRRITKEVATLAGQLPLTWESSVLAAMDDDRMDVLRWGGWGGGGGGGVPHACQDGSRSGLADVHASQQAAARAASRAHRRRPHAPGQRFMPCALVTSFLSTSRAVIFAPHDTPYANGAFAFDILLPPDYPNHPPKVSTLHAVHASASAQGGCAACLVGLMAVSRRAGACR